MSDLLSEVDRLALDEVLAQQDRGWTAGDAEGFCAAMLAEVTFTNVVGQYARGREAFIGAIREVLAGMYRGSAYRQAVEAIALVTADLAVVDTVAVVSGFVQAPPGGQAVDGHMYQRPQQVMVRRSEGWRVAAFHNVIVHPAFLKDALVTLASDR